MKTKILTLIIIAITPFLYIAGHSLATDSTTTIVTPKVETTAPKPKNISINFRTTLDT